MATKREAPTSTESYFTAEGGNYKSNRREVGGHGANNAANDGNGNPDGGSGGGVTGVPIQLQAPIGNRKEHPTNLVYSGTTFIGPGKDQANPTKENTWYRFPWEHIQAGIRGWIAQNQYERYLTWKAEDITVTFKNPLCIQDISTDGGALATAGQNMHAQVFGYMDTNYATGISTSFNTSDETLTQVQLENLMSSWGNHGYGINGQPIRLPKADISRNSFQHNFPDVKNIGVGPGSVMKFGWNIKSPYWRSTMQLFNQMTISGTDFVPQTAMRWDEHHGVTAAYDPNELSSTTLTDRPLVWNRDRDLRKDFANSKYWVTHSASTNTPTLYNAYVAPTPMPKIWLQLQPQLGGIAAGVSDAVVQLQFEVNIKLNMSGQCPAVLEAAPVIGTALPERAQYCRRWIENNGRMLPLFRPIMRKETYT